MRFQVPQFINIEDKIFGPLTIKQFVYVVGAAGMGFILYKFLPLFVAILFIVPVALFAIALAFVKVNNKPFIFIVQAAIQYLLSSRLYIWKRIPKKIEARKDGENPLPVGNVPALSESKLKDLTWALDVNENIKAKK